MPKYDQVCDCVALWKLNYQKIFLKEGSFTVTSVIHLTIDTCLKSRKKKMSELEFDLSLMVKNRSPYDQKSKNRHLQLPKRAYGLLFFKWFLEWIVRKILFSCLTYFPNVKWPFYSNMKISNQSKSSFKLKYRFFIWLTTRRLVAQIVNQKILECLSKNLFEQKRGHKFMIKALRILR